MCGTRTLGVALLMALLLTAVALARAQAQVYHWVDDQEVIHYTTGIDSVPERYRPTARALPVSTADLPVSPPPVTSGPAGTTIPFVPGAPILISVRINGAGPATLILDTGAARTMVSPDALARLGIPVPGSDRATIRGVTGATLADVVLVQSLEVGNARVGPLAVIAHDAGLSQADGLLGRDVLSLFSVAIDIRTGVVTLAPN